MRLRLPSVAVLTCCSLALAPAAPAAPARGRADLVVTALRGAPSVVARGASTTVTVTVRNRARAKAKRSRVGLRLSSDRKLDRSDLMLAEMGVRPLAGRRSARVKGTLAVPAGLAPGDYFVMACADSAHKIRERNERNNCRAVPLRVAAPPQPQPGPGPEPTPGPGPAPGDPGGDGPRVVTVRVDDAAGVTQTVGESGGVLQLSDRGTTWTLVIPSGALARDTQISMHPLTSVGDYPFAAGDPRGVQLGPEGLTLDKPAELRIAPVPDIPPEQLTTFAWNGDGADFRLYPTLPDTWRLALEIHHFSGYGAGGATTAERTEQLGHEPASTAGQFEQELAELTGARRACQLAGTSCGSHEAWLAAMREIFKAAAAPIMSNLRSAATDEAGDAAINAALAWQRRLLLYGIAEEDGSGPLKAEWDAMAAAIDAATVTAYERAWRRCAHSSTAPAARTRLMFLLRRSQLGLGAELDETRVDRCIRFRLSFESEFAEHSTETGKAPRTATTGKWTWRYSDLLIVQVGTEGKWSFTHVAPSDVKVTEKHTEKRWCGDEMTPDYVCQTTVRELESAGEIPPIGAFIYPQGAVPVLDLLFAPRGDDVEVKIETTSCAEDGGCAASALTAHDFGWTNLAGGLYADLPSPFAGMTSHLWVRPPLAAVGADTWRWTRHTTYDKPGTVEAEDFVSDATATVEFAGGE
jgi:CARDB protein